MKIECDIPDSTIMAAIKAEVEAQIKQRLALLSPQPAETVPLMSLEDTAVYLGGVSKDWIYQRTARNEIPFVKVGRLVRFNRAEIDRWLAKQNVPAVSPLSASLPARRARDYSSRVA